MVHIPIAIEKEKISVFSRMYVGSILGTFLVGMLLGVFATGNFNVGLPINTSRQLAGVGEALSEDGALTVLQNETPIVMSAAEDATVDETLGLDGIALPATLLPSPEEVRTSLNTMINERTVAADRLGEEMLRIKNESIALIEGFDQNCANWNDACAAPYKEALDKNNAGYERLVQTLATWNQEISDARATLALTTE
ncbi:MAG: hypothetical protein A2845_05100 [Candidatus Lloydbacteria bacterium RIFCSPHIGHO2_01_FULL_49_22]|uniref:Uncharacterized protein n=1 Tax=Candidatus Lloydbacteria bacterium RIFCSPHIGHO2_01_FULL_49_22 TaxID=1798658 RepID=A0A1G2CVU9_9BACT|nr:MAG: hypothetical protein A2845_05100 [Candidatus Lloydbacteria bacterium RIFCSPHIGHO2_01_FULL_49_22]OGZ09505.1 MAG: hypothetical protein A3C14_01655 [Candidatus Lloydbacteria bacterium RIFCSPHIGHO2_02_FULL_50_18]